MQWLDVASGRTVPERGAQGSVQSDPLTSSKQYVRQQGSHVILPPIPRLNNPPRGLTRAPIAEIRRLIHAEAMCFVHHDTLTRVQLRHHFDALLSEQRRACIISID